MRKPNLLNLLKAVVPLVCSASLISNVTSAATIEGQLTTAQGEPIAGAIISLFNNFQERSESVYTDGFGFYRIETESTGEVKLRARAPYFKDQATEFELTAQDNKKVSISIYREEDPVKLSGALTASAHAATLKFESEDDQQAFRSQCHFCHQIGNELTRRPRTEDEWQAVINRMEGYGVVIHDDNVDGFKSTLAKAFDGSPVKAVQTHYVSPELARARYDEWQFGDGMAYIHDIEIGGDGKIYGVDMGNDLIWILDTDTHEIEQYKLPPSDLPMGGQFSGAVAPLGSFNSQHGPHSIQEGPDGKMWTTNSLSGAIMSFDPETKEYEVFPIGGDAIYPHTLRFDQNGTLWFTLALSNQIAKFDINTKEFTIIDTPSNGFLRWITDAMLPTVLDVASWYPKEDLQVDLSHHKPTGQWASGVLNLPYGIDVNPLDGGIWYSKLYSGYIGYVNPETLEVDEIKTPLRGPRRLRFDAQGILWIPSFEESALMRFDPKTREFIQYPMPTLAPDEYESPYALGIHPETQDIWITSNMSDRVFRFIPSEERFISYPSPTRVAFLRDMVFMEDGRVCSSNANLPAHAIEGGRPKMLCIDPDAVAPISETSTQEQYQGMAH